MLVVFDCDGVLVDSEILACKTDVALLSRIGVKITLEDYIERYAGLPGVEIFRLIGEERGAALPEDFAEKSRRAIAERMARELEGVPGARAAVLGVDAPVCVASNSRATHIRMALERADVADLIGDNLFSSMETGQGRPKPAPDVFLHAAEAMGIDPRDGIAIEDSVHGVAAARAAGMRVIGFIGASHSWPGHGEALAEAGAETVVRRLVEVPATVAAFRDWRGVVG